MIVSHQHHFVFVKSVKTAGTSIEMYFEQYCSDKDIIGVRCDTRKLSELPEYYNHMTSELIRDKIGQNLWNSYYKFTVVRNPWDKVVSWYFFKHPDPSNRPSFKEFVLANLNRSLDWHIYSIDGKPTMDYYIRYETLKKDIAHVCQILNLPCDLSTLGHAKGEFRNRSVHYSQYYDQQTKDLVAKAYHREIKHFGYEFEMIDSEVLDASRRTA